MEIIDYSNKSFAVIGDTYQYKDELKELGGKWNSELLCGKGWIFPLSRKEEVVRFIKNISSSQHKHSTDKYNNIDDLLSSSDSDGVETKNNKIRSNEILKEIEKQEKSIKKHIDEIVRLKIEFRDLNK